MQRLFRAALVALTLSFPPALVARPWEKWNDCRFQPAQYFDGDSFHFTHRGRNQILRLYFADAPEIDASFPERVREQAAYFRVSETALFNGALRARQFTRRFLEKPFSVLTRREPAPGASRSRRVYGRVESSGRRLDEALIRAGLARATALPAAYPDARAAQRETLSLRRLEQKAAQARRGIWQHARRPEPPRARSATEPLRLRTVNLNVATQHELEALPGIGPKLATRIIRARPLSDFAALEALPGIGPGKTAALRPLVTFD